MSVENWSVIPSHSRLSKHKPTYLRHFSLFHLLTTSLPFSKPLLSSTFLPLDPCFLNRSLSRRKPHNNPLSRLLWGLIFLPKNAIKTHNLATKTRKNSAKTLKKRIIFARKRLRTTLAELFDPRKCPLWAFTRGRSIHFETRSSQ